MSTAINFILIILSLGLYLSASWFYVDETVAATGGYDDIGDEVPRPSAGLVAVVWLVFAVVLSGLTALGHIGGTTGWVFLWIAQALPFILTVIRESLDNRQMGSSLMAHLGLFLASYLAKHSLPSFSERAAMWYTAWTLSMVLATVAISLGTRAVKDLKYEANEVDSPSNAVLAVITTILAIAAPLVIWGILSSTVLSH